MSNLFDMKGKRVVVTGGCGGIGGGIVRAFSEAGARVAIMGRSREKLDAFAKELSGGEIFPVASDVTDLEGTARAVKTIAGQFGGIDVLVNSAGTNVRKHFLEVEPADYDLVMDVNVKGLYFISQAAGRVMAEQKSGKIINIASLNSFIALSRVSVYATSKGAVAQLTKAMAVDMARYNVQVNAVAPGFIKTPFNKLLWNDPEKSAWIAERTLLKRFGMPEDLCGTLLYLGSAASDFVTGQIVTVDGGFLTGADTLFG